MEKIIERMINNIKKYQAGEGVNGMSFFYSLKEDLAELQEVLKAKEPDKTKEYCIKMMEVILEEALEFEEEGNMGAHRNRMGAYKAYRNVGRFIEANEADTHKE